jgi:glycosyltransferase involved in cell wall biosynthesis
MKLYADLVFVSNSNDKKSLLKKGFRDDQVLVTFGAIDTGKIPKAIPKIEYDACFVGRFHIQKGLFDLIEIWKRVCKKKPDARLAVVGEGSMMNELVMRIEKEGLSENIVFHGFLDGRKKFEIIQSSSVFVFPSTYESFGMAALEAMACGVPVVAYSLAIFQEIYPKGMIKVSTGDVDSFADAILELLYNVEKKTKIGNDAYELSLEYTWEKTANEILTTIGVI